jgi:hypothetical protein
MEKKNNPHTDGNEKNNSSFKENLDTLGNVYYEPILEIENIIDSSREKINVVMRDYHQQYSSQAMPETTDSQNSVDTDNDNQQSSLFPTKLTVKQFGRTYNFEFSYSDDKIKCDEIFKCWLDNHVFKDL